jgi:hypothetical protein
MQRELNQILGEASTELSVYFTGMCGRRNREEISKFSLRDAENYERYEKELEQFVLAVDSLLGKPPSRGEKT